MATVSILYTHEAYPVHGGREIQGVTKVRSTLHDYIVEYISPSTKKEIVEYFPRRNLCYLRVTYDG